MKRQLMVIAMGICAFFLFGCSSESDWTRRDMPTEGLTQLVSYQLRGTAGAEDEKNFAQLRGVNENAPTLMQETIFGKMGGSTTQDVQVTMPDGRVYQALGMVKTKRFAGLSSFMSVESVTYSAVDNNGKAVCGAKIRIQFNRNLMQYQDPDKRDYDSLWYYDVPCQKEGHEFGLNLAEATLRSITLNQVWQARIASGSHFFNWGHSVTIVGGPAQNLRGGWWMNWDIPETSQDTMGAGKMINAMLLDLETSSQPWLEFSPSGEFSTAHLIYSASDADQYASFDRLFLDRHAEYVVFYRPNVETAWDYITVRPIYNYEWNDVQQVLAGINGWNDLNPFNGKLTDEGMPKDMNDAAIKEIERVGWMNSPNTSLEQIQFVSSNGQVLYAMTVRAFLGASDTLVMFGPATPPELAEVKSLAPATQEMPRPIVYDEEGEPVSESEQDFTPEQWAEWQREATMWNFLRDNPHAVGADLMVQFRFQDNTSWTEVYCRDSDGDKYVCDYRPVVWDLSTSYYFNDGNVKEAWLISQLLGEVGVRTLGMSYASGLYQGTGMLFAMSQIVHREEFFAGYQQESIWTFDARASQLPDRLAEAWQLLHQDR